MQILEDDITEQKIGLPRNLEGLSIYELEEYIASLKLEILRTESEIERHRAHKSAAESLFKAE